MVKRHGMDNIVSAMEKFQKQTQKKQNRQGKNLQPINQTNRRANHIHYLYIVAKLKKKMHFSRRNITINIKMWRCADNENGNIKHFYKTQR